MLWYKVNPLKNYFYDPEFKVFIAIQLMLTLICFTVLMTSGTYQDSDKAFDQALFQSVSISTTAGFTTTSFADWPTLLPILLIFSSFIGGCAASTAVE